MSSAVINAETSSSEDLLSESQDGITRLILNRPDRRNALSLALMRSITERLQQIGSSNGAPFFSHSSIAL